MIVLIFFATLFFLLFIGVPIGLCLAGCAMVMMYTLGNVNMTLIAQTLVEGSNNLSLMAIPFFMLAGELMSNGGLSRRIVDFSNVIVGRFRGGLGYVAVIARIIFAGLSGSAVADTALTPRFLQPMPMEDMASQSLSHRPLEHGLFTQSPQQPTPTDAKGTQDEAYLPSLP